MGLERPPNPIVSTRADDPEVEERIDAFVVRLGESLDALQDLETAGDYTGLAERARTLAVQALELGYPPLAEAAERIEAACREQAPEATHKSVADLTPVVQRIRRGHRSAA